MEKVCQLFRVFEFGITSIQVRIWGDRRNEIPNSNSPGARVRVHSYICVCECGNIRRPDNTSTSTSTFNATYIFSTSSHKPKLSVCLFLINSSINTYTRPIHITVIPPILVYVWSVNKYNIKPYLLAFQRIIKDNTSIFIGSPTKFLENSVPVKWIMDNGRWLKVKGVHSFETNSF